MADFFQGKWLIGDARFDCKMNKIIYMSSRKIVSYRSSNPKKLSRNSKHEEYSEQMQQSMIQNISQATNPEHLLKFLQEYHPLNPIIVMDELLVSDFTKLKRYKQATYYGEMLNNRKHGKGIMIYNNGRFYQGEWANDYKHGVGYEQFANKCIYHGDYANGKPEGVGKYIWPNGQSYDGEWKGGIKNGSGMWRGIEGDSYIGEWKNGKVDGYGVHIWSNGDNYEGQFKQCLKHGQGIQKFANGDIYKGSYINGKPNGYGEYFWGNGSYYKGNFKNGLRHGKGLWKKNTGCSDKYEGEYINDKKNGYGVFTWASGNSYSGDYQADNRHGSGQMKWTDGSIYRGQWKKGVQHGRGELFIPSKGWKKGIFQDNVLIVIMEENQKKQDQMDPEGQQPEIQQLKYFQESRPIQFKGFTQPKNQFRSREISTASKNRPRKTMSIDEKDPSRSLKPKFSAKSQPKQQIRHYQTLIPKPQFKHRQTKYITLDRRILKAKQSGKERLLHSSFYLHKMKKRDSVSAEGGRTLKNLEVVRRDMFQEMGFSRQTSKLDKKTDL